MADELKAWEPTLGERLGDYGQRGLEAIGIRRPIARRAAQTAVGGPSSALPMNMGLVDAVGMVNPVAAATSAGLGVDRAIHSIRGGDTVGGAIDLAMNLPQLAELRAARAAAKAVPKNPEAQLAEQYMKRNPDLPTYKFQHEAGMSAPSSAERQEWIGKAHQAGVQAYKLNDPAYKAAVFHAIRKANPDLIAQTGAQHYDDLMKASYAQAAKETKEQFKTIPNKTEWWGNADYEQKDYLHRAKQAGLRPAQLMRQELEQGKPLQVYGDREGNGHPYLSDIDPETGANANELFRAVHDYYGHLGPATPNQFGPKGEENAWLSHRQMYSPLAEPAMTAETRGQNSYVNYADPENVALRAQGKPTVNFAENVPVLLPPEASDPAYKGGLPSQYRGIIPE